MKVVLLALMVGILLNSALPVAGQDAIAIEQNDIVVDFPTSVTFYLTAKADAGVEQATLIYGTDGRSCHPGGSRQPLRFTAGPEVELDWEWELYRLGGLPPGAEIWWQWEVTTANGQQLTTERLTAVVKDESHDWLSQAGEHVTVHWYTGSSTFASGILQLAEETLARLSGSAGLPPPDNIHIWLYASQEDMHEALMHAPEWAGGTAFPAFNTIVADLSPGEQAWAEILIPHELSHLVVAALTDNCRGIGLDTWLSEGLADYGAGPPEEADTQRLISALEREQLPPLRSLTRAFSAYGDEAGLAYAHSHAVVDFLISTYGPDSMAQLMDTVQAGAKVEEALQRVYGFDTDGLDARWRASVGHPATPTPLPLAASTNTPVPTAVLFNPVAPAPTGTPAPAVPASVTATAVTKTAVFTSITLPPTEPPTATDRPRPDMNAVADVTPVAVAVESAAPTSDENVIFSSWPARVGLLLILLVVLAFTFIRREGPR
jgi:hypothetical protein